MNRVRAKVVARGVVQGVGFRPFVYRLASEMGLHGSVLNSSQGVFIEIEGDRDFVQQFLLRLEKEKPPRAVIQSLESSFRDPVGYERFEILYSEDAGEKTVLISPDIATCRDCVNETFDPKNRRFRYPFTNCTNCGPRFSIIESLPYDRAKTSMKKFTMCDECEREYHDPRDRRFHVCTVMGYREYEPIAERFRVPIVITGFEPIDILEGVLMAVRQLEAGTYQVENQYPRVVQRAGNRIAQDLVNQVFEVCDRKWRGVGSIPKSGYKLRYEFREHDAERIFETKEIDTQEPEICISGLVLKGVKKPHDCPAFGKQCTPEHPLGATMVSAEGACAAYYAYGRHLEKEQADAAAV